MGKKEFKVLVGIQVMLIGAMFILGSGLVNFTSTPPLTFTGLSLLGFLTHVLLGLTVVVLSLAIYSSAQRLHNTLAATCSMTSVLFVLISALTGALFVWDQNPLFPYAMSLGFVAAFGSYVFLLSKLA